jgi:hypothetical protein
MLQGITLKLRYRLGLLIFMSLPLIVGFPSIGTGAEGRRCPAEPTDMIVQYGDLITCRINTVADVDVFRFSGVSGETAKVNTSKLGGAGSPIFEMHRPNGTRVACNAFGDCPLDATGTHTIQVTDLGNNHTVDYALVLERLEPPSPAARRIQYDQQISEEINGVGDMDLFFFSGEAGDTVRITATKTGGTGSPVREVYRPDGTRLPCNAFGDCPLDQTGIFTIVVSELGNNHTVKYLVTLVCLSGVCVDPVAPDVSGCVQMNGAPISNSAVELTQTGEPIQSANTDANGCYRFENVASGKDFEVTIVGPTVP